MGEVARFNNYIDAIYRRMNAALRAKMMDPMELNLNDKANKKTSDKKKITKRDAEEDDDEATAMEIDHRMGKNENKKGKGKKVSTSRKKKNGKKGKGKGKGKNKEEEERREEEKEGWKP